MRDNHWLEGLYVEIEPLRTFDDEPINPTPSPTPLREHIQTVGSYEDTARNRVDEAIDALRELIKDRLRSGRRRDDPPGGTRESMTLICVSVLLL